MVTFEHANKDKIQRTFQGEIRVSSGLMIDIHPYISPTVPPKSPFCRTRRAALGSVNHNDELQSRTNPFVKCSNLGFEKSHSERLNLIMIDRCFVVKIYYVRE